MHGIVGHPLTAPEKAEGFKGFYNFHGRMEAAGIGNGPPFGIFLGSPLPISFEAAQRLGQQVYGGSLGMITPAGGSGDIPPVPAVYAF
jgi:hypothetical protein